MIKIQLIIQRVCCIIGDRNNSFPVSFSFYPEIRDAPFEIYIRYFMPSSLMRRIAELYRMIITITSRIPCLFLARAVKSAIIQCGCLSLCKCQNTRPIVKERRFSAALSPVLCRQVR